MFVGRRFGEEVLLGLAFAFEQATGVGKYRRLNIRPTADLLSRAVSTSQPLNAEVDGCFMARENIGDEDLRSGSWEISEMVRVPG